VLLLSRHSIACLQAAAGPLYALFHCRRLPLLLLPVTVLYHWCQILLLNEAGPTTAAAAAAAAAAVPTLNGAHLGAPRGFGCCFAASAAKLLLQRQLAKPATAAAAAITAQQYAQSQPLTLATPEALAAALLPLLLPLPPG
jgi:hypothetical protein